MTHRQLWWADRIVELIFIGFVFWACGAVLAESECHTDTECMALCSPSDDDCDGGPQ